MCMNRYDIFVLQSTFILPFKTAQAEDRIAVVFWAAGGGIGAALSQKYDR